MDDLILVQSADSINSEATSKTCQFCFPAEWDTMQLDKIPSSPTFFPTPPQLGEVFVFCDQPWDIRSRKEGRKEGGSLWGLGPKIRTRHCRKEEKSADSAVSAAL